MKRTISVALVLGLVFGAVATADAAKRKPVKTNLYLHGTQGLGEAELPDTWISSAWLRMDPQKPDASTPKSMFVTNYLVGPNTACSGNGLLPTWKGDMSGTVVGDITLHLHTIASPAAKLQADLFADGTGGCDSAVSMDYVPPNASVQVDVAPGHAMTEIVFEDAKFKVGASLVLMLFIPGAPANPYQVRVLYDGAGFESGLEFSCIPATGKACA